MKLSFLLDKQSHTIEFERAAGDLEMKVDGEAVNVEVISMVPPRITFQVRDRIVTAHVVSEKQKRWVHVDGATLVLEREDLTRRRAHSHGAHEGGGSGIVVAPMPGQVRAVLVAEGDVVTEGQPLLLLEAMKMELKVAAPHDGTVRKIMVTQGQSVEREQILAEILESESE